VKRYGQHCPVARALDVVGERWSLLIVRELSLGPRRHRELAHGLPGIPTNTLSIRLKELQAAGVIAHGVLPPPAAVPVYELTDAGRALRGVLTELREWGAVHGSTATEHDTAQPGWFLAAAAGRATDFPEHVVCELRVDGEVFHLAAAQGTLVVEGGSAHVPDAVLTMGGHTVYEMMHGHLSVRAALRQANLGGRPAVARAAATALSAALTQPVGVRREGPSAPVPGTPG
jgi:DNA-binding HxlR family transcriptional regulator